MYFPGITSLVWWKCGVFAAWKVVVISRKGCQSTTWGDRRCKDLLYMLNYNLIKLPALSLVSSMATDLLLVWSAVFWRMLGFCTCTVTLSWWCGVVKFKVRGDSKRNASPGSLRTQATRLSMSSNVWVPCGYPSHVIHFLNSGISSLSCSKLFLFFLTHVHTHIN